MGWRYLFLIEFHLTIGLALKVHKLERFATIFIAVRTMDLHDSCKLAGVFGHKTGR